MPDLLLGVIADDFTGATDIAGILVNGGLRVVQAIGVPAANADFGDAEAVVVALKSRTAPVAEAVSQSLAALEWLQARGAGQIFFKYCSTFDSTTDGNIGPVADALMDRLAAKLAIVCPAFPENGRTIFKGHLFVGDQLLSASPMRDHPLTPMTDSDLVRLMAAQSAYPVGLVTQDRVARGSQVIRAAFDDLAGQGTRYAVVDAIADDDLMAIGEAVADHKLVTGGSGVALGLPANLLPAGRVKTAGGPIPDVSGPALVLAGSCSAMTWLQVRRFSADHPALTLDALAIADGATTVDSVCAWLEEAGDRPALIYSTAEPETVRAVQDKLGRDAAGKLVETLMGEIARKAVAGGIRRLVVAGGETSGAVVQALNISALHIGAEIAPGVPWTTTISAPQLALALKSGNFGGPDFFADALDMLP